MNAILRGDNTTERNELEKKANIFHLAKKSVVPNRPDDANQCNG